MQLRRVIFTLLLHLENTPSAHKKRPAHVQAFIRSTDRVQNDATIEPLNCFLMNSFTSGDWYALTSFFTHG